MEINAKQPTLFLYEVGCMHGVISNITYVTLIYLLMAGRLNAHFYQDKVLVALRIFWHNFAKSLA